MFNFFSKKEGTVKTTDIIWMSDSAKTNGLIEAWKKNPSLIIICWFENTVQELQTAFAKETTAEVLLYMPRNVNSSQLSGKQIIFAEHHPLKKKEQEVFSNWQLKEAVIHSSLDEPLFQHFGGERMIDLMKKLGMQENESVQHSMISSSIKNAQEKMEKKMTGDLSANSQKEWIARNIAT